MVPDRPRDRALVGRTGEDGRQASGTRPRERPGELLDRCVISVVPGRVGRRSLARRVEVQRRASYSGDERVRGRPVDDRVLVERPRRGRPGDAKVVGGGQDAHLGALVIDEGVAQAQQGRPLGVLLGEAEALADDVAQVVCGDVVVCGDELGEPPTAESFRHRCLDDDDVRPRSDLMRHLDIARCFARFLHHLGICRAKGRHLPDGLQYTQGRRRPQPQGSIEGRQVLRQGRRPEGVDDHDRTALAVKALGVQGREVVGTLELLG